MEMMSLVLTVLLTAVLGWQFLKIRHLEKLIAHHHSHIGNLAFRHSEACEFLENQIDKLHFQMLARADQLKFNADSELTEVLSHNGAREILVKSKLLKKKDEPDKVESLGQRAKTLSIPLEPVLVKLNMLETRL